MKVVYLWFIRALVTLSLAVSFSSAHAASVTLSPVSDSTVVGGAVVLEVWMDFTSDPTIGGGLDLSYDDTILGFDSWTYAGLGDVAFAYAVDTGTAGEIVGISFGDFGGLSRFHSTGRRCGHHYDGG